jgi:hypothetical protein
MPPESFANKLNEACVISKSDLLLFIAPALSRLPLSIQRYDDPLLPFGRAIINATQDLVCGYMFDLAAYLTLGAAGAIALERTLPLAGNSLIRILHGPFYGSGYAAAAFSSAFSCDAVTLVDDVYLEAYTAHPGHGAFVVQQGLPRTDHLFGVYWMDFHLLTYPLDSERVQHIRLVGHQQPFFAVRDEDFDIQMRQALEKLRDV